MDLGSLLRVIHSGLTSNLWGLACPFYCGPSGIPSLVLAFLFGFLCALCCVAVLLFTFCWPVLSEHQATPRRSPSSAALRLRQYVDARR